MDTATVELFNGEVITGKVTNVVHRNDYTATVDIIEVAFKKPAEKPKTLVRFLEYSVDWGWGSKMQTVLTTKDKKTADALYETLHSSQKKLTKLGVRISLELNSEYKEVYE